MDCRAETRSQDYILIARRCLAVWAIQRVSASIYIPRRVVSTSHGAVIPRGLCLVFVTDQISIAASRLLDELPCRAVAQSIFVPWPHYAGQPSTDWGCCWCVYSLLCISS